MAARVSPIAGGSLSSTTMSFFRRLRRDTDATEETERSRSDPAPTSAAPVGEAPIAPTAPAATLPESGAPAAPIAPAVSMPTPRSAPPPLPESAPDAPAKTGTKHGPFSLCFVCGTPLERGACSTCRMTWVE